jgi:hypothetical protein
MQATFWSSGMTSRAGLSGWLQLEHPLQKHLHVLDSFGVRASIVRGWPTTLETVIVSRERHTGLAVEDTADRLFVQVTPPTRGLGPGWAHRTQRIVEPVVSARVLRQLRISPRRLQSLHIGEASRQRRNIVSGTVKEPNWSMQPGE